MRNKAKNLMTVFLRKKPANRITSYKKSKSPSAELQSKSGLLNPEQITFAELQSKSALLLNYKANQHFR